MEAVRKPAAADHGRIASEEYQLGLAFFKKKKWKTAARHFSQADRKSRRTDENYHLYTSCHGLALVYCGDVSGLNFCRHAAAAEKINATVFQNLALAELHLRHRRRACDAVSAGLELDARHSGLLKMRRKMGVRRRPCVPFLKRNNPFNRWLGRITYHRNRKTVRALR
ncbi:MAG: hypothetical protein ACE5FQ_06470 [Thiogranum sp.]